MNLRRSFALIVSLTAALGAIVAAALIVTTTRLHLVARRVGIAVESVRISEEIAIGLVSLRDADDAPTRAAREANVRQRSAPL